MVGPFAEDSGLEECGPLHRQSPLHGGVEFLKRLIERPGIGEGAHETGARVHVVRLFGDGQAEFLDGLGVVARLGEEVALLKMCAPAEADLEEDKRCPAEENNGQDAEKNDFAPRALSASRLCLGQRRPSFAAKPLAAPRWLLTVS